VTKKVKLADRRWWPWLKRGAITVFFIVVACLIVSQARDMDWAAVLAALQGYSLKSLVVAALLAVASFALYSCFDLLGRHYTGHALGTTTVMAVTFISYVFNLNFGSLVGGVAFRFRLYAKLGLATGTITRILSLSMLTNWMGYLLLGGLMFSVMPPALPNNWAINALHLRLIGGVLVGIAAGYLALCGLSAKHSFSIKGHFIALPSARMAALQLTIGAANWLIMAGIVYMLLQQRVAFPTVVSVLLLAGIAGVITHIPAGLGVLEGVFVALLSRQLPPADIVAALVAYRVIYYLAPLGVAAVVYVAMEAAARKLAVATPRET